MKRERAVPDDVLRPNARKRHPLTEGGRAVNATVRHFAKSGDFVLEPGRLAQVKHAVQSGELEGVYRTLWLHLQSKRAVVRFAAALITDELFTRSVAFRRLLTHDLRRWCEQCLGTNKERPLPDPDGVGLMLRENSKRILRGWHERFVPSDGALPASTTDYRRLLDIVYHHVRDKLGMDFAPAPQTPVVEDTAEQRRRDAQRRAALAELDALHSTISTNLMEIENGLDVLFPSFEDRFQEQKQQSDMDLLDLQVEANVDEEEDDGQEWEEEGDYVPAPEVIAGILNEDYAIDVAVPTGPAADAEEVVGRTVREAVAVLKQRHLDTLQHWRRVLGSEEPRVAALWERAEAALQQTERLMK